ncbi:MAG: hypothetical protein QXX20_03690 [Candidatus Thermoplasmatota archaeon]
MNGKKVLTMLIVCAIALSTLVVLNKFDIKIIEQASAIPGVNAWGKGTQVTNSAELTVSTEPIDIGINTTGLVANSWYYLYYPRYYRSGTSYNLTMRPYGASARFKTPATVGGISYFEGIVLNCSGLWIVVTETVYTTGQLVKLNNFSNFNASAKKWFWVNASKSYTLTVSPSEIYYRKNATVTFELKNGDALVPNCIFDVRRKTTNASITSFPRIDNDGQHTFKDHISGTNTYFNRAGNYTVRGYVDTDAFPQAETYGTTGWNITYGKVPAITADYYNYVTCGPWDPPEYQNSGAEYASRLWVRPGEPTTSIPTKNQTMYWGRDGMVNISVQDYDKNNLSSMSVKVFAPNATGVERNVTQYLTITKHVGFIDINSSHWGQKSGGGLYAQNGTWTVFIWKDIDGDGSATNPPQYSHEWNTTVTFTVEQPPKILWKWIDDDGVNSDYSATNKNNDGVIPMVPKIGAQPLSISFQIIDQDNNKYGGGSNPQAMYGKNITITGDALYLPTTLDKLPGDAVTYSSGTWTVNLTPIMKLNGGQITFTAKWKDRGTVTETLTIGGTKVNGTVVTISPTEFTYGENVTFTVTVKDSSGYAYPNARVYLYWMNDNNCSLVNNANGKIAEKLGGGTATGEYVLSMNTTIQRKNQTLAYGAIKAPRNISAYVQLYRGGSPDYIYGYAMATMKARSDFKVTVSPNTVMAGERIPKIYFNTSVVDSSGNTTRYPSATGLKVRIYNSTGHDVTADIGSLGATSLDGAVNKSVVNQYFTKPGVYTVYAYNNTYNSRGWNATFTVQAVDVTCDISEFIWRVDKNISATFTVNYQGKPVNGTLKLYNITDIGAYNKTWVNYSNGEGDPITLDIKNGVATLSNITANALPGTAPLRNITFEFKPKTSGSAYARANGRIPVKIANVASSVYSIPYNKPAQVTLTITGRGVGLPKVFVSIIIPGLSGQMNSTTNADGQVTFAFTPPTTGDVIIKVENKTSDVKIKVTSWVIYLEAPVEVDELGSFTVTARNGSSTAAGIPGVAVVFAGTTKTTGSDGKATFTAPAVTSDRTYTITATKEGYAEDKVTITVVNIPKLFITVSGEKDSEGTYISPVTVVVSDDLGNLVTGATVTFGSQTSTTVNGQATFTVTGQKTAYTITAVKTGFTSAEPVTINAKEKGIPGFELLTLIGAIGVAFILLRRRRHQ